MGDAAISGRVAVGYRSGRMSESPRTLGLIRRYRDRLPAFDDDAIVSIGEGGTPLIRAPRLGARLGVDLHLKYEGLNPTGSFKDRGMTTALSAARQEGARAVICASTGNTSASAAAYAARAGIRCVVVIPGGKVALGKLAQAQVAGAQVVQIDGSFDDALRMVRVMSEDRKSTRLNSSHTDISRMPSST